MKCWILGIAVLMVMVGVKLAEASVDTFGIGANQFTVDFVNISGATNPASGIGIVNNDYRMGTYEITNDQWNKFKNSLGVPVTGSPSSAYDASAGYTGANVPTNNVSWYEAAQFVNWLNTSTGHHAAYKFTGMQGTSDYTFANWNAGEAANGTNLYRHKDAFYFLPTEDEWGKAAYWNGSSLQSYATKAGNTLFQGNGTNGGWNYAVGGDWGPAGTAVGPWKVGSGSQELNGTYDMMGNVWEWMEGPDGDTNYVTNRKRGVRGGSITTIDGSLLTDLWPDEPTYEQVFNGFRVASVADSSPIPEPSTVIIWSLLGGLGLVFAWRKRKAA